MRDDESDVGESALEQMDMGSEAGPSGTQPHSGKATQHPEPSVLNLLLAIICGDIAKFPAKSLSGCPITSAATVTKLIHEIRPFKTAQDVAAALSAHTTQTAQLLSWISSQGAVLAPATSDMKIPGFKDTVHQFVVLRPNENSKLLSRPR